MMIDKQLMKTSNWISSMFIQISLMKLVIAFHCNVVIELKYISSMSAVGGWANQCTATN
jgi:hypothetical protein